LNFLDSELLFLLVLLSLLSLSGGAGHLQQPLLLQQQAAADVL
jgi:hypothetical protein